MLGALEPLRELADQETLRLQQDMKIESAGKSKWEHGQQTERYLKRYIEIFREQSFAIISMYRSIFPPPTVPSHDEAILKEFGKEQKINEEEDPLGPMPSALAGFPMQLVTMLESTLRQYLPSVRDKGSRDSLLTQVLYCAGSLGRLGGDFGLILAFLNEEKEKEKQEEEAGEDQSEESEDDEEWVEVIRKHRVLAGRLELMVGARDG